MAERLNPAWHYYVVLDAHPPFVIRCDIARGAVDRWAPNTGTWLPYADNAAAEIIIAARWKGDLGYAPLTREEAADLTRP